MENITQLICSLTLREQNLVLKFYDSGRRNDALKRLKLFRYIINEKTIVKADLIRILGSKYTQSSIRMLSSRLMDDILKIIVFNRQSEPNLSEQYAARLRCRSLIGEFELLTFKGLTTLSKLKLRQAERVATKYDFYAEKIIIDELKTNFVALRQGLSAYNTAMTKVQNDVSDVQTVLQASDYFRKVIYPNYFFVGKNANLISESKLATEELKKLRNVNKSPNINYYYLRSEIYYHHLIGNYKISMAFAKEFLQFVLSNPAIGNNVNIGGAHMVAANISLFSGDPIAAIKYSNDGFNFFGKGTINQLNILEILFYAKILLNNLDGAEDVINQASFFKDFKSKLYSSAWMFYKANVLFLKGKHAESLALLQKHSDLIADKSGWRIGYKILEMMCIIEMGNYDWLDYRIETFRKLLSDVKKENIARPKAVLQIIKYFIRSGYNFKQTNIKSKDYIQLLEDGKDDYKYDPKGYEIIRFDGWWKAKVKSTVRVAVEE